MAQQGVTSQAEQLRATGQARLGDIRVEHDLLRRTQINIQVQAPRGVRDQIAATVHRVPGGVDDYGCPTTDPISFQRALSPEPRDDVSALRDVSSVSACRYELDDGFGFTWPAHLFWGRGRAGSCVPWP